MKVSLGKQLFLSALFFSNAIPFCLSDRVKQLCLLATFLALIFNCHLLLRKKIKMKKSQTKPPSQETEEALYCHSCIENLENWTKGY